MACLVSVLRNLESDWARLIIVNDSSPNPGIVNYLNELDISSPEIVLLRNETNMGFVAAANRGMAYDIERDVMLLNSDVEVSGDWLSRLREAAYQKHYIASVTPFSNNATICSFPNFCEDNRLFSNLPLGDIDDIFSSLYSSEDVFEIPTGVGCCLYIRRDCLNEIGYFDLKAFGRGYGEENDWCQRAQRGGWSNLHLASCFVHHVGGVSFGDEYKARVANAQKVLDKKHPRYHADVHSFIANDPARGYRVRALLGLYAMQDKPKVLMISHKLGGGAQQHVEELVHLYHAQALFLQIIPDVDGETVRVSYFDNGRRLKDGLFFTIATEYEKLVDLLRSLGISRVHFHHTMGLPTRLWGLSADLGCDYDLTIHDYYLLNGNPTLTDSEARYVSETATNFDELCTAGHYPLPVGVSGDQWRNNQRMIVEGADRVIFPSRDSYQRFSTYFAVTNALVAWHTDYQMSRPYCDPEWDYQGDRALRVLVLGALSREKGADVLEGVAALLADQPIEFHMLGYAYRALDASVISHGPYDNLQVDDLVKDISPDVIWFPALWPETYSYTLSVALRNGIAVVVPNIGAFPERVMGRNFSPVVNWDKSLGQWREFWLGVMREQSLPLQQEFHVSQSVDIDEEFYSTGYLQKALCRPGQPGADVFGVLDSNLCADTVDLSTSEKLLDSIWRLSRQPIVAKMLLIVPFKVQRSIKRFLSHRPMHDIVGK